tara:strand:+ start:909 stop:1634 length:726 start_codon:yes stop_codon:yes gene_type:complete
MSNFWSSELPEGYYDKIFKNNKDLKKGLQLNWHSTIFKNIIKDILKNSIHLDYACGPGTFIGKFSNFNSVGVDISKLQIDYAEKNYSKEGKFFTINEFDFEKYKNKFDVITVLGLLEFIDFNETQDLLSNLTDLLKPEGKIIFTTPNYGGLMPYLENILNLIGPINYKNEFKTRYTSKKIDKIFSLMFNKFEINKILNFGILFSLVNVNFSNKAMFLIDKIFNNYFGYIFKITVYKKDKKN